MFGKNKYDLGIALGGGGSRGFAHLGVLAALAEKDIYPDIISGVSAGAIMGAFVASGLSAADTHEIIKSKNILDYSRFQLPTSGLLSLKGLEKELKKNIKVKDIKDLEIPLIIGTSNLNEGKMEYFSKGPLIKLVLASSAIPILFSPIKYQGNYYADGGVFNNIPVEPLKKKCKKIIAVDISPLSKARAAELDSLKDIAARSFQLMINSNYEQIKKDSDVFISPKKISKYMMLDTSAADEIYQIGYDAAKKIKI